MFNTTHTFVGLAIARTGVDKWAPHAAMTAVIASNLPDIDIVTSASGTATYLDLHRGITHTLIGVPILALLVAAAMYFFSGNFWKTFVVAFVVMATHPALDYTNTYGLRPFLPFDGTWYYGDLLYIFDPYIDLILLSGIVAGVLMERTRKVMAWVSLVLLAAYIGARIELREMAKSQMEEYVAHTAAADQWAVFPTMLNPFVWDGIIETKTQLLKVNVDALDGVHGEIARVVRGASSDIVNQAANADSAAALLRFARFPVSRVEGVRFGAVGYRVLIFDFRFYDETDNTALGAQVELDQSFHVKKESLSFAQIVK